MNKILKLIPDTFRKRGAVVACLVPLRALLDLLGVAVLFPILFMVMDSDNANQDSFMMKVSQWLGFTDNHQYVVFLVICILMFIIIKSFLNLGLMNYQNKYLLSLYNYFSAKLFSHLYGKGLLYVKNSNTSEIAFNINSVCYSFVVSYLSAILKFSGELMFSILLLTALSIYDPFSALFVVVTFIPVIWIYLKVVRRRLKKYGKAEMLARREQQKIVLETFKGYAEMEVNDAFPLIHERFNQGLVRISNYRVKTSLIQSIPNYMLELAVAVVLSVMVLFSMDAGDASMRVFLGVFAIAMIRMLPSVHSMISSWGSIKASEYTLAVIDELSSSSENKRSHLSTEEGGKITFENNIQVQDISFSYPTGQVINGLSFEIHKGERFGIKGRTGAGKSTLFNLLLGFFTPDDGSIMIDGVALTNQNMKSWHEIVGYVPQEVFIADLSLAENIALGHDIGHIDTDRMWKILEMVSLKSFVESLPDGINTRIGEGGSRISGGQRQRIGIARAIYKGAQVLFFDEATSSLDTRTEKEVNDAIRTLSERQQLLTMIIISHRDSSLKLCDRIMEI